MIVPNHKHDIHYTLFITSVREHHHQIVTEIVVSLLVTRSFFNPVSILIHLWEIET